ncbi:exonuclease domain-containing protein [Streptomyces antimycoticus]|uniref:exonuclease domain-containing protein n=1 Tax=Streptomyces antimycoticus TaxID=68175 RepID=UPI00343FDEF3
MSWHTGRLLAFDTETTGTNVEEDRIVTAAAIGVGRGEPAEPHTWLANPGIDIPEEATAVHGISTEHAHTKGMPAEQTIDSITTVVAGHLNRGVPIVGHNVVYDLTILDRECRRYGLPTLLDRYEDSVIWPVIDTRVLDQHVLPFRRRVSETQGARQLITLAQVYGFGWDEEAAHGSEYDALMAARIAYKINAIAHAPQTDRPSFVQRARTQRFNDVAGLDLEGLHHAQIKWAAEQAASLQEWFRKKDPAAVVNGSWPLIPHQAEAGDR